MTFHVAWAPRPCSELQKTWARRPCHNNSNPGRFRNVFVLRKILKRVQSEQLEESLGRPIEDRPTRLLGASGDLHEMLFHQAADRLAAGHPANCFDVGAEDRL